MTIIAVVLTVLCASHKRSHWLSQPLISSASSCCCCIVMCWLLETSTTPPPSTPFSPYWSYTQSFLSVYILQALLSYSRHFAMGQFFNLNIAPLMQMQVCDLIFFFCEHYLSFLNKNWLAIEVLLQILCTVTSQNRQATISQDIKDGCVGIR